MRIHLKNMKIKKLVLKVFAVVLFALGCNLYGGIALAKDGEKEKLKAVNSNGDNFAVGSSTNIDFSEAMIDGKYQAPQGFFLQGRQPQALMQMVKLRSNFRQELRNSRAAVKSVVR